MAIADQFDFVAKVQNKTRDEILNMKVADFHELLKQALAEDKPTSVVAYDGVVRIGTQKFSVFSLCDGQAQKPTPSTPNNPVLVNGAAEGSTMLPSHEIHVS